MISFEDFLGEAIKENKVLRLLDEKTIPEDKRSSRYNRNFYLDTVRVDGEHKYSPEVTELNEEEAKNPVAKRDYFIFDSWQTGGKRGGSYGPSDEPKEYVVDVQKSEPENLDKLLEKFTDIPFLAYKRLIRNLVNTGSYTETEYYGNSTNYGYKLVFIKDLYKNLVDENLFKEDFKNMESVSYLAQEGKKKSLKRKP